jgi:hypothetical protein
MFSLGNKNKKKGYKQVLAPPTRQKVVWGESTESSAPAESTTRESPVEGAVSVNLILKFN